MCMVSLYFLANPCNQQVVQELIVVEVPLLMLLRSMVDCVEVVIEACGLKLSLVAPKGMHGACVRWFERYIEQWHASWIWGYRTWCLLLENKTLRTPIHDHDWPFGPGRGRWLDHSFGDSEEHNSYVQGQWSGSRMMYWMVMIHSRAVIPMEGQTMKKMHCQSGRCMMKCKQTHWL